MPTVTGDLVVIKSCNGVIHALQLETGQVRWETKVGPDSIQYFFHGDPYVTDDVVVIGTDATAGGSIRALDRLTGRQL